MSIIKANRGFMLIELVCYLGLASWLLMLFFHWLGVVYIPLLASTKEINETAQFYGIHSLLKRDLTQASHLRTQWRIGPGTQIQWDRGDCWVGYTTEQDCIVRIEGFYDPNTAQWSKKKKAVLGRHMAMHGKLDGDHEDIKGVQFFLHKTTGAQESVSFYINLRNGKKI
jgi:hypothetical protein